MTLALQHTVSSIGVGMLTSWQAKGLARPQPPDI